MSCFTDAKTPNEWKKLTTWWPWTHSPQTYLHLRIDDVDPCDTTLFPHHQPVRELCTSWSHTLQPPSLTWHLKCFAETHWGLWAFWALAAWTFCLVPCSKLTCLHHSLVSVDWLCCAWVSGPKFCPGTHLAFYWNHPWVRLLMRQEGRRQGTTFKAMT